MVQNEVVRWDKKIRKPTAKPTILHKDKNRYNRKVKHKEKY